jgi:hypothetical protein
MDLLDTFQALNECGPAKALSIDEISTMLKMAAIGKNDIFYDLGSGHGRIVREVAKKTRAKRSNGIELDVTRFCKSISITKKEITKKLISKNQLKRIDLWRAYYEDYDFSDATIIYNGLSETDDSETDLYRDFFKKKRIKIIKIDLPLIAYRPVRIKVCKNIRFFLMNTPLQRYRVYNKEAWARYVLPDKINATIGDVYDYYTDLLIARGFRGRVLKKSILDLKKIVSKRFK